MSYFIVKHVNWPNIIVPFIPLSLINHHTPTQSSIVMFGVIMGIQHHQVNGGLSSLLMTTLRLLLCI